MTQLEKLSSSHPDYARAQRLARLFSLSIADYEAILTHQNGHCAICPTKPKPGGNRLSVDHDHKTGLVRGLLCWNCNRALGRLKDNLVLIEAMARYLSEPPATTALGAERLGRKGRTTNKAKPKRKTRKKKA